MRRPATVGIIKVLGIVLLASRLAACNVPVSAPSGSISIGAPGPHTWIDAPLDQMHIPLAPYEVVFHASDDAAIAQVGLTINDQPAGLPPAAGAGKNLVTMRFMWSPAAPGQYVLRARSQSLDGNWSGEAQVTVWVGDVTPTPTVTPTGTVTVTPTTTPAGDLSVSFLGASTDKFYFGDKACGPVDVMLEAQVSDTQQIRDVLLFFKLRDIDSGKYTDWNGGTDMDAAGNGRFRLVLESKSILDIAARENYLIYQFVGTGATNQSVARSPVYSDITLSGCGRFIIVPPPG